MGYTLGDGELVGVWLAALFILCLLWVTVDAFWKKGERDESEEE